MRKPLEGLTILEFSQYLAGPYCGLRLADLGARVIKIERPGSGDACRQLATKNLFVGGDSLVFHTINRNKESFEANLKDPEDLQLVKKLIAKADGMTHNFRPGVMEKIGLDYERVRQINPSIIYGEVSGYGKEGPWKGKPGQDLLAQSVSGICHLSGSAGDSPVPMGLASADMLCGTHLGQGMLAAMVRRGRTGQGARVEVSLLESLLDFQFEALTTYLNDGGKSPQRASYRNAHAYLGAPYGIYETEDGFIALAMGSLETLSQLIEAPGVLELVGNPQDLFNHRDEIKKVIADRIKMKTTDAWLSILEAGNYWCSDVYNYARLLNHAAYKAVDMEQEVRRSDGTRVKTLRCPIRIDGERLFSDRAAPVLGSGNEQIKQGFIHA